MGAVLKHRGEFVFKHFGYGYAMITIYDKEIRKKLIPIIVASLLHLLAVPFADYRDRRLYKHGTHHISRVAQKPLGLTSTVHGPADILSSMTSVKMQ
jgi:hypothetical protein